MMAIPFFRGKPMKRPTTLRLLALAFCLVLTPMAHAQLAPPEKAPPVHQAVPRDAELVSHGHYRNKAGQEVHSPSQTKDGKVPAGASAQCRDGSYSFSKSPRGTCSGHGGVANWLGA